MPMTPFQRLIDGRQQQVLAAREVFDKQYAEADKNLLENLPTLGPLGVFAQRILHAVEKNSRADLNDACDELRADLGLAHRSWQRPPGDEKKSPDSVRHRVFLSLDGPIGVYVSCGEGEMILAWEDTIGDTSDMDHERARAYLPLAEKLFRDLHEIAHETPAEV